MHKISVFSSKGDSAVAVWEDQDVGAIQAAKELFDTAVSEGWGAVTPTKDGAARVDEFSPELDEIFLLKPIAGG